MNICEGRRSFYVTQAGYKLYNENKTMVDQSFLQNLNSKIKQVSAYGN